MTAKPVQRSAFSPGRAPSPSDWRGVGAKSNTSGASGGAHEWPGSAPRLHSVALPPMPRFADIPVVQAQTARSLPIQRQLAVQRSPPSKDSNDTAKQNELSANITAARGSIGTLRKQIEKKRDLDQKDKEHLERLSELAAYVDRIERGEVNQPDTAINSVLRDLRKIAKDVGLAR
jgi:hypothetical protein